jgi:hypothetical protein
MKMRFPFVWICYCTGAVTSLFSLAAAHAGDTSQISLTIYNDNLALVEEQRGVDLIHGRNRLEFKNVSASIRPETVALSAAKIDILEQNFDFDLLTPQKLMAKSLGQQVQLVRINPGTGEQTKEPATVLSVNQGVVLRVGDHIEVLREDNIPTRVLFDKVPDNLRANPTLSVTVNSESAGTQQALLSYLSTGLSWKADYVAVLDEGRGKLDMQGWITLTNNSGTTFSNAKTQLVAGKVNILGNDRDYEYRDRQQRVSKMAGNESGSRPTLADYYVYPLKEKTTVADQQTKQVSFLEAQGVAAQKNYSYFADWFSSQSEAQHADVVVQFKNSKSTGLGAQLPAGVARVYVRDAEGNPKFVGENRIGHTPQGSDVAVKIGEAFDITVQPTLVKQEKVSLFRSRYSMEYLIRNAKPEATHVDIRQSGLWRDGKVLDESLKSKHIDAYTLSWDVPVSANGETKLTFTVETGW